MGRRLSVRKSQRNPSVPADQGTLLDKEVIPIVLAKFQYKHNNHIIEIPKMLPECAGSRLVAEGGREPSAISRR